MSGLFEHSRPRFGRSAPSTQSSVECRETAKYTQLTRERAHLCIFCATRSMNLACARRLWHAELKRGMKKGFHAAANTHSSTRRAFLTRTPSERSFRFVRSQFRHSRGRRPRSPYMVRKIVSEFMEHYHRERNHQGLGNRLIEARLASAPQCRPHQMSGFFA